MTYVISDGEVLLAALKSSDSHPDRYGLDLLGFASNSRNLEQLREALPRIRTLPKEEVQAMFEKDYGWEDDYIEKHPEYIYQDGIDLLCRIMSGDGNLVINRFETRAFDDWAYIMDLDGGTFEVYKGMNKEPLSKDERFYDGNVPDDGGYFPPKKVCVFRLDDLPSYTEFVRLCNRR